MSEHELWNELGNLYFMSGAYNQAMHAYKRSIQCDTSFGRPYSNLALAYVQQGKYDEAIELYRRSIELLAEDKEKAISWNRLGSVYRHLKDYSQAVIAFQEADWLDPHSVDEFPANSEMHRQAAEAPSSVLDAPAPELVQAEPAHAELATEPVYEQPLDDEPIAAIATPSAELDVVVPEAQLDVLLPEAQLDVVVEEALLDVVPDTELDVVAPEAQLDVVVPEAQLDVAPETELDVVAPEAQLDAVPEAQLDAVPEAQLDVLVPEEELAPLLAELGQDTAGLESQLGVAPTEAEPDVVVQAEAHDIIVAEAEPDVVLQPEALDIIVAEAELDMAVQPEALDIIVAEAEPDLALQAEAHDIIVPEAELAAAEPEPVDDAAFDFEAAGPIEQPAPELEWWDIDEERLQSAAGRQPVASLTSDDANASWTAADASQFQQDVSQMPETGSLTTWGDADFDDDFEFFPLPGADADQGSPEPEDGRLSAWIPLPEDAPMSLDELWVPPFLEDEEPEPELPLQWNESPAYHVINSTDFGPALPPLNITPEPVQYVPQRSEPVPARQGATQQTWDELDVEVAVEERPAAPIALGTQASPRPVEPPTAAQVIERQPAPSLSLNAQGPALPDTERDENEMREIEMGIAKFRRVVQVNPRNAHAWDALGTLFKSAGLYKDAILAYQQAISNDSSKSLYYHHLGLVYACEGRDEDAISAFQQVLEIDPNYSLAHATLGGYYRKMGLEELAQKHIGKAMRSIFDSENEYNRACLEAICGNADQAIELLGVALKNKQTYVDWILRDPDLDFIRQDPRFKQLISDYTR